MARGLLSSTAFLLFALRLSFSLGFTMVFFSDIPLIFGTPSACFSFALVFQDKRFQVAFSKSNIRAQPHGFDFSIARCGC
jgi:hypothetical protein